MSENVANQLIEGAPSFGPSGTIQASDGGGAFTGNSNVSLDVANVRADYFVGNATELSSTTDIADGTYGNALAVSRITVTNRRLTSISEVDIPGLVTDTLSDVVDRGNTTSDTIQFTQDGKGMYYAGNVVVLGGLDDHTIRIGKEAGETDQGARAIAIGQGAGQSTQSSNAIAIGYQAGQDNQNTNAIAVGYQAGQNTQSVNAIAVGYQAGQDNQNTNAIAVGYQAGQESQSSNAITVGHQAGQSSQSSNTVAIGYQAGQTSQGSASVALGYQAGQKYQGSASIAIGSGAGQSTQGSEAVAVGYHAGEFFQGACSVAVGWKAAEKSQNTQSVAIGHAAGQDYQGSQSVAVGQEAGQNYQSTRSVAVGYRAAETNQGSQSVAIGYQAGQDNQSSNAIAIGYLAGQTDQHTGSIIINATGSDLNSTSDNSLYIKPIRPITSSNLLHYNATSGEITTSSVGKVVAAGVVASTGTAVKQFGANTSKSSTGDYTITFATPFASGNHYVVNLTAIEDTPTRNFKVYVKDGSRGTHTVNVLTADDSTGSDDTLADHPFCYSIISLV